MSLHHVDVEVRDLLLLVKMPCPPPSLLLVWYSTNDPLSPYIMAVVGNSEWLMERTIASYLLHSLDEKDQLLTNMFQVGKMVLISVPSTHTYNITTRLYVELSKVSGIKIKK